jgi:GR25 family glycosyltransferase involved in LPS biosynthesis
MGTFLNGELMNRFAWVFALLIFFSSMGFAKLEDHFKKASGKSSYHTMKNIDFIYTINLDQRPEKFLKCTEQLHPYQIYPYRFSAVNGWELSLETINDVGVKFSPGMTGDFWGTSYLDESLGPNHDLLRNYGQVYFCHCMGRGPIGIVLSHLSILQDALDSGYKTIWVMEDDIEIVQNPKILSNLIQHLDAAVGEDKWDMLFTDRDTKNQQGEYVPCKGYARSPNFEPKDPQRFVMDQKVGSLFRRIGARYGAYSVIVRRSGMEKILRYAKTHNIFLPYDMFFYLPDDMRIYTVQKDVVSTEPRAISDNGGPNYLNKQQ